MKGQTIFLVIQESMDDGEILINVVPCSTMAKAKKVLAEKKHIILHECRHYAIFNEQEIYDAFEIEEEETKYYINDPSDDYYEEITIVEREIL